MKSGRSRAYVLRSKNLASLLGLLHLTSLPKQSTPNPTHLHSTNRSFSLELTISCIAELHIPFTAHARHAGVLLLSVCYIDRQFKMPAKSRFQRLDAFSKTVDEARVRTTSGGFITITSLLIVLYLAWGEWADYRRIVVHPELIVDKGRGA